MFCEKGWAVVQRRSNGSEDFKRDWVEYKEGFGNFTGEFWLGNDKLQLLTKAPSVLLVELKNRNGDEAFAVYNTFQVRVTTKGMYRLLADNYYGTAGDALGKLNEALFSAHDSDNDDDNSENCAGKLNSAWWYKKCDTLAAISVDLNGNYTSGMHWLGWSEDHDITSVAMKIRPKQGKDYPRCLVALLRGDKQLDLSQFSNFRGLSSSLYVHTTNNIRQTSATI